MTDNVAFGVCVNVNSCVMSLVIATYCVTVADTDVACVNVCDYTTVCVGVYNKISSRV